MQFSYPAVTPLGHDVTRNDEPFGDFPRVHLSSPESQELYVEVVRFTGLSPEDEYREHRRYLEQRFGADAVTALTETTLANQPAWTYAFRWPDGERAVFSLSVAGDTFRFIYDPRSELNAHVLATVVSSDSSRPACVHGSRR